jgi:hypothetical protein
VHCITTSIFFSGPAEKKNASAVFGLHPDFKRADGWLSLCSRGVVLTGSNEARVQLEFAQPDLDLVKFASVFGLTVCYDEQRRAFLPNATPDYF